MASGEVTFDLLKCALALQIIPAPLFSCSSLTWLAVTTIYVFLKCGNVRQSNCMTNMSRPAAQAVEQRTVLSVHRPLVLKLCLRFTIGTCSHVRNYQFSAAIFVGRKKLGEV